MRPANVFLIMELSNSRVYRFTGLSWDPRWDGVSHKVNERIPCDVLESNVDFYVRLFRQYGK